MLQEQRRRAAQGAIGWGSALLLAASVLACRAAK